MKKIIVNIFSIALVFLFIGCETDINKVTISGDPTAPVLNSITVEGAFQLENEQNQFDVAWSVADFGYKASINYILEVDVAGNNFSNAATVMSSYDLTSKVTFGKLNSSLTGLGLEIDKQASVELRIKAEVSSNTAAAYSNVISLDITPYPTVFDPIFMIGDALKGWDTGAAVEFPGIFKGVYEGNAMFTNGKHFRFFKAADWGAQTWGPDNFTTLPSELVDEPAHSDDNFRFDGKTGFYKMNANFNTQTITLEYLGETDPNASSYPDNIFLVGSINGWNNNGLFMPAYGNNVHGGFQYLDNSAEFKLLVRRGDWSGAWGAGAAPGQIAENGDNVVASTLPSFDGPGFYEIKANLAKGTVTLTKLVIGVIGDATAGGWDTDVDMTFNTTTKKWEASVTFSGSGEFKFRANDAWDIDFGGALDNIEYKGSNIATPGAGTYKVVLDISAAETYTATVTKE
ncbi:MAG: SusE domain-containing protein [Rhodothermaceae bacterium]